MRGSTKLFVIAGTVALAAGTVGILLPPSVREVRVVDGLGRMGERTLIEAQVVEGRIRGTFGGVEKALVFFEVEGGDAGAAATDDHGTASVRYSLPESGPYQVVATAKLPSGETLEKATGLLWVPGRGEKIVVVDVDGTIADVSELGALFKSQEGIPPVPGAVEGLKALARDYIIVYLTRRDEDLGPATKKWLAGNGFPPGPAIFSRSLHDPFDAASYKRETLRRLKLHYQEIIAGIGNTWSDAEAYREAGIRGYLIGDVKPLPQGAQVFSDWNSLVEAIARDLQGR